MNMRAELLFDLVESEADVNIFLDREGFKAEKAGLIITSSSVGHLPKKRGDHYTVWFGRGIERWTFKTFKEAIAKCLEILKKADPNIQFNFRFDGKRVKQFNKIFAKVMTEQEKKDQ